MILACQYYLVFINYTSSKIHPKFAEKELEHIHHVSLVNTTGFTSRRYVAVLYSYVNK